MLGAALLGGLNRDGMLGHGRTDEEADARFTNAHRLMQANIYAARPFGNDFEGGGSLNSARLIWQCKQQAARDDGTAHINEPAIYD